MITEFNPFVIPEWAHHWGGDAVHGLEHVPLYVAAPQAGAQRVGASRHDKPVKCTEMIAGVSEAPAG